MAVSTSAGSLVSRLKVVSAGSTTVAGAIVFGPVVPKPAGSVEGVVNP
jgi:hypothetical protein